MKSYETYENSYYLDQSKNEVKIFYIEWDKKMSYFMNQWDWLSSRQYLEGSNNVLGKFFLVNGFFFRIQWGRLSLVSIEVSLFVNQICKSHAEIFVEVSSFEKLSFDKCPSKKMVKESHVSIKIMIFNLSIYDIDSSQMFSFTHKLY